MVLPEARAGNRWVPRTMASPGGRCWSLEKKLLEVLRRWRAGLEVEAEAEAYVAGRVRPRGEREREHSHERAPMRSGMRSKDPSRPSR